MHLCVGTVVQSKIERSPSIHSGARIKKNTTGREGGRQEGQQSRGHYSLLGEKKQKRREMVRTPVKRRENVKKDNSQEDTRVYRERIKERW